MDETHLSIIVQNETVVWELSKSDHWNITVIKSE